MVRLRRSWLVYKVVYVLVRLRHEEFFGYPRTEISHWNHVCFELHQLCVTVSGDVEPRTSLQAGAVDEGARSTRSPCAFASLGGNPHQKSQALDNLAEKLKNYANSAAVAAATRVSEAARESGQGDGEASVDVEDINVMIGKEEQDDTAQLLPMPAKKKGKSKNKSHHSSSSR